MRQLTEEERKTLNDNGVYNEMDLWVAWVLHTTNARPFNHGKKGSNK